MDVVDNSNAFNGNNIPQQVIAETNTISYNTDSIINMNTDNENHKDSTILDSSVYLENILTQNFDKVSIPTIITLTKYINNIIDNPYNDKYRSINMNNKVFQTNIAPVKSSAEYLISVGFIINNSNGTLIYPQDSTDPICSKLQIHRNDLYAAMDRLNIPTENRPQPAQVNSTSNSSSVPHQNIITFDPYKANIVRQAPQVICLFFFSFFRHYLPVSNSFFSCFLLYYVAYS